MKAKVVSVRLNPEIREGLKILAEAPDRTQSFLVNHAEEAYLADQKWQIAAIHDGLSAVEQGELASEQRVRDVFAKWGVTPKN